MIKGVRNHAQLRDIRRSPPPIRSDRGENLNTTMDKEDKKMDALPKELHTVLKYFNSVDRKTYLDEKNKKGIPVMPYFERTLTELKRLGYVDLSEKAKASEKPEGLRYSYGIITNRGCDALEKFEKKNYKDWEKIETISTIINILLTAATLAIVIYLTAKVQSWIH